MTAEVILNLDYGSFFLKSASKLYEPGRTKHSVPAFQLSGSLTSDRLVPKKSATTKGGGSLKEGFLGGRIPLSELVKHRGKTIEAFQAHLVEPLAKKIASVHRGKFNLLLNIHTPLRLDCGLNIQGCGLFDWTDREKRLVAPVYKAIQTDSYQDVGLPPELAWALWLGECLAEATHSFSATATKMATLPESLVALNRLIDTLPPKVTDHQWLVLDVGHFTTDFCLVAADRVEGRPRLVVRRASSIFGAGSGFIRSEGQGAWKTKVLTELQRGIAQEELPHAYMDLKLVLMGGGLDALDRTHRLEFLDEVKGWANAMMRHRPNKPSFSKTVAFGSHQVAQQPFQAMAGTASHSMRSIDLTFHHPSLMAAAHAEDFVEIRVPAGRIPAGSHTQQGNPAARPYELGI